MTDPAGTSAPGRKVLAEAFDCALAAVPEDARLGHPAAWDSIGHLRVVLSIEQRIGRLLSPDEIVGIASLVDVEAVLQASTPREAGP
jgi:acyl carrier protein